MQNPTIRPGFAGECYKSRNKRLLNLARFPKRCRPPKTLSRIVAGYLAARRPRGPYRVPLPEDTRQ